MRILLKDFQEEAVTKLARHVRGAAKDSKSGDHQSVCLSSTTGSGKTVMLTRAIELILQGDDDHVPISDATFLWITDQPELNEQTRKKMLWTSSVLTTDQLLVISGSFDQETLSPGTVHFLNIQKLGKDKGLVMHGDARTFTIWEIISNTITARPGKFFVIIDEAHRGMSEANGAAEAATIIQKFIKGSPGELPAVPVIVGLSATPERFNRLIVGTNRMSRPIDIDVADVRASGLIKDTIVLHHPTKEQPTDMTMLREAARALKKYSTHWESYCAAQEDFTITPLLVVQVEDASRKGEISETDIAQCINLLRDELGAIPNEAFAHAFQEGVGLEIDGQVVRYLAPSEVQDDSNVRVVFFKTSLNTGWDCPRAEVMMSFRRASDATYIAQLVGRMVRTPLARRIVDDEFLNTVALYLPHYDSRGLERIVKKLSKPEDGVPPIDVEIGEDAIDLRRRARSNSLFDSLSAVPSYVVPRKRKTSQVRRLMKLARLLTNDGLDENAISSAKSRLLGVLNKEYSRAKKTVRFKEIVNERRQIEIEAVNWNVGTDITSTGEFVKVDIAAENVDDLFEASGRRLNEGLHKEWWRHRVIQAAADRERAKLELFALCIDPKVIRKLEKAAQESVQEWLKRHRKSMSGLDESSRAGYEEVRNLAATPELGPLSFPAVIRGKEAKRVWKKHVYVSSDGTYPADLNKAETQVMERELAARKVVGWLRNIDRKPWSLCVPYTVGGEDRAMYPDFLVIRKEGKDLVVDVIDPHSISLADAPAKAAGLARFASLHASEFGKIELVMVDGNTSKRLNLCDETVRDRVKGITLPAQLRELFSET
jgi:type III restriction enzyme